MSFKSNSDRNRLHWACCLFNFWVVLKYVRFLWLERITVGKGDPGDNVTMFQERRLCPWVLGRIFHSFIVLCWRSVICIHRGGSLCSCPFVVWLLWWQTWRHLIRWWMVLWNQASEALVLSGILLSTSQMLLDKCLSNSKSNLSLSGHSGVVRCLHSVRWISYKSFWILERIRLVLLLLGLASLWFLLTLLDPFWSGFCWWSFLDSQLLLLQKVHLSRFTNRLFSWSLFKTHKVNFWRSSFFIKIGMSSM